MRVVIFALLVLQGSTLSLRKPPNAVLRLRGGGKPGKLKDNVLYKHIVSPDSPVVSLLTTQAKQAAEDKLNYEENSPLVGVITLDGARSVCLVCDASLPHTTPPYVTLIELCPLAPRLIP